MRSLTCSSCVKKPPCFGNPGTDAPMTDHGVRRRTTDSLKNGMGQGGWPWPTPLDDHLPQTGTSMIVEVVYMYTTKIQLKRRISACSVQRLAHSPSGKVRHVKKN